jgi:hypothetical protein
MKRPPAAGSVSSIEMPRGPKSAKAMPKPCFGAKRALIASFPFKAISGRREACRAAGGAAAPAPGLVNSNINGRKGIATR